MEKQLTSIADSFERIASTLEWIQREGLELYSKSGCFNVRIGEMPLSGFVDLSVELKNPIEISQS